MALSGRQYTRLEKRQAINEGGLILTLESAVGYTINGLSSENKGTKSVFEKQVTEVKMEEQYCVRFQTLDRL